jgi:hypothetical protein
MKDEPFFDIGTLFLSEGIPNPTQILNLELRKKFTVIR